MSTSVSTTERSSDSWRWWCLALLGGLTAVSLAVLAWPSVPLGVPGEWVWARRAWLEIDLIALAGSGLLCGGYWWVATWGEARLRRRGSDGPIWLPVLLAFVWLTGLLLLQPEFQGLARSPTVLFYKRTEGYFWQAAFEVQDSREFLHNYHDAISRGDDPDRYLHIGTHPPGLTLGYCGLLSLFDGYPGLADGLIAIEPPPIREAFDALREYPTPKGPLTRSEEATLWAATLLTLAAAAGACWPISRLASRIGGPIAGWRAAMLWPLVPSLLVFFPKSDLLCPMIATMSCWLWLDGWSRQRWGKCVLAGVGFCLGLMLTLALAPVALLLIIQTIMERWTRRAEFNTRCVRADVGAVGCAVVGVAVPLIAVSLWGQCNIIAIWFQNLQNHGMFYTHNSRSFGTWLAVNPMEAAFALGLPIAGLVILGTIRSLRDRASAAIGFSQTIAWIAVWLILWLSGKNMGEAARLWIFLAPWPVITAATATLSIGETKPLTDHRFSWQVLLALQLLVTLWTMVCVDGFHFAELIPAS